MDGTVLVADDDRTIRTVLTQALTRAGCKVRATSNTATLWQWISEGEGDAVVSDVMMPDGNGLELLPAIRKRRPQLPVIVISAQNTVMTAIKASEAGAFEYLPKPFDLRDLLAKVSKALTQSAHQPDMPIIATDKGLPLVGGSAAMQEVYRVIARVINTNLNVLITGESGTGKDLLARSLHDLSQRADAPFLRLSCAGISPDSLQSSLLKVGTGATVYLDELAELSQDAQIGLLALFQSPEIARKNLRFISSCSTAMAPLVETGQFREDLFYRLNVMPLDLPPLSARLDDIGDLVQHFLQRLADEGQPLKSVPQAAIPLMRAVTWKGNLRGLFNFVQRLVVLSADAEVPLSLIEHQISQLDSAPTPAVSESGEKLSASVERHLKRYFDLHGDALPPPGLYNRILREVELPLIALSLSETRGNQIKTAELLGINRNTLRKKIKELDIQVTRTKKIM